MNNDLTKPAVDTNALSGSKPSLESIFGTQAPSANRPPLDSILGIKKTAPVADTSVPLPVEEITQKAKETLVDPFVDRISKIDYANQNFMSNGLQTTAGVVGGGFDVLLNGLKGAYEAVTPENIQADVKSKIQQGIAVVADAIDPEVVKSIQAMAEAHPEIAGDLDAILTIGLPKGLGDASKMLEKAVRATEAFKTSKAVGGEVLDATGKAITDTAKATADALVVNPARATRDFTVGLKDKAVSKAKNMVSPADKIAEVASSPEVHPFVAQSPEHAKLVTDAVKQGYEPNDIKFLSTISEADKPALQEMMKLAEEGATDKRKLALGKRPMDVVGDSTLAPLKEIQKINRTAGEAVDSTARALTGTKVDTSTLSEKALQLLSDNGITITMKPNGQNTLNFSKSIFKKTPAVTKVIQNALSDMPNLTSDAYDLHKFKKSLDEVVEYGTGGEGLKGKSQSILKQIRALTDDTLDSNFADYNKANTDFRKTRDLLDTAHDTFGNKLDFLSTQANKEVGGKMRALFSERSTMRPKLFNFLSEVQNTAKEYGVKMDVNPADQALYAQLLEDVYGTPAITGFKSQVGKGVEDAVDAITNTKGFVLKKGLEMIDKMSGSSIEEKKRVLKDFIKSQGASFNKATVSETVSKAEEYVYHTTSPKNLESIMQKGLIPKTGQYGKAVYFAPTMEKTGGYGSPEGLMIRAKKDALPADFQEFSGEQGWTSSKVDSSGLEYSKDGGKTWQKMKK